MRLGRGPSYIGAVLCILGSATVVSADENYNFNITTPLIIPYSATGSFTLNGSQITSVNGSVSYDGVTYALNQVNSSDITGTPAYFTLSGPVINGYAVSVSANAPSGLSVTSNSIIGDILFTIGLQTGGRGTSGFFDAELSSGGSSGGGQGSSGGAPSPEVNAFLGLALAGGTVAFLRRKRAKSVA